MQLSRQINRLLELKATQEHAEFNAPALALSKNLARLTQHAQALLELQSDIEQKYPAMPILLVHMEPINREMIQFKQKQSNLYKI